MRKYSHISQMGHIRQFGLSKRIRLSLLGLVLFFVTTGYAYAQPFADDIKAFKKQDSISAPPKNAILFVGSSSFTMWKDVKDYFPGHTIVNRGFGGSSLPDLIRYIDDVIFPYDPKQIVIYCGENDLAGDTSLYPAQVAARFEELFNLIRARYKKVPIVFISLKPSPSRQFLMPKFNVTNVMISNFLKTKKKTKFIDVYHAMLNEKGEPIPDIFLEDELHMNKKGYAIWQKLIEPHLLK